MTRGDDETTRGERVDQIISLLLHGRRLHVDPRSVEDEQAIRLAASLSAARTAHPRMPFRLGRRIEGLIALDTPGQQPLTRRALIWMGIASASSLASGLILARLLPGANPAPDPSGVAAPLVPVDGRWIDVGLLADLGERSAIRVLAGSVPAFVFLEGSRPVAVTAICSHLPCELWWDEVPQQLVCPCHPARFARSGQAVPGADGHRLPSLTKISVRTDGDRVQVLGT